VVGRDRRKKGRAGPACPELEVGAIPVDFGIIELKYCATQRDTVMCRETMPNSLLMVSMSGN
jgi:hypothetical protein